MCYWAKNFELLQPPLLEIENKGLHALHKWMYLNIIRHVVVKKFRVDDNTTLRWIEWKLCTNYTLNLLEYNKIESYNITYNNNHSLSYYLVL
jgi:hypothetical protein